MRSRPIRLLASALLAALVLGAVGRARASEEQEPIDLETLRIERKLRSTQYPVNPRISRYLGAAAKTVDAGTPEEGQALLDKLNPKRLNPMERALLYRMKAYIAYSTGDYEGAVANFEKVLEQEILPVDADNKIRFNIAQIHASLEKWEQTIADLDRWFRYTEAPDPLAYYLKGISYYQLDKLDLAIENTRTALEISSEPREGWIQLLAALYIQKEDYPKALPLLELLVVRYPKKQYWVQLSLIYGALDDYRDSLAVQQVAYLQGLLDEDKELRRLARSYLYHDLPYPAAAVLEKGIESGQIEGDADAYELLANSLISAREYDRSLAPLQKAADLSKDGNLFVRLGQVYLQREDWKKAADELQMAINRGGLKNPGTAHLLLGIAYYNDERVDSARSAFARARQHESTQEAAARWIEHIDNEAGTG